MANMSPELAMNLTGEDVSAAEALEQEALNASQRQYLTNRVVILQAQLIQANRQIAELRTQLDALEAPAREDPSTE